jgi:hypothetical protein
LEEQIRRHLRCVPFPAPADWTVTCGQARRNQISQARNPLVLYKNKSGEKNKSGRKNNRAAGMHAEQRLPE